MTPPLSTGRRSFLRIATCTGGGLLAGFVLPTFARMTEAAFATSTDFVPNAFIRISPDNWTTVIIAGSEMGQGVSTALPMLVAEELDADWSRVRWEQSPTTPAYDHPVFMTVLTGASMTTSARYLQQRQAGAAVRSLLVHAAARRWSVDADTLITVDNQVLHTPSSRSVTYGELVNDAATMTPPTVTVALKDPKRFRLIGQSLRRLDGPDKTNGQALFGLDVVVPDMAVALLARPPLFGGKVRRFHADEVSTMPGVLGVFETPSGVAVVGKDFWSAKKGRDALRIEWEAVFGEKLSSPAQRVVYAQLMDVPGLPVRADGDVADASRTATRSLTADFSFPYLAHVPMEPLNAVVDLRDDRCEIWTGTQWPSGDLAAAARVTGLRPDQVVVHTTLLGGGFGRRAALQNDFVVEAVEIAMAAKRPIKYVRTREDDIRAGFYRPSAYCRLTATLDADDRVTSVTARIATQSINFGTVFAGVLLKDGLDGNSTEGAHDLPYAIPNVLVDVHNTHSGVPVQWMRSVGHSFNAYPVETFIDEIATATKSDPYRFRRRLLATKPRHRGVLDAVATAAGWGTPLPKGRFRGIAQHASFESYVAQVVELSVDARRVVTLHRVVCAVDCGVAVNPDLVKAQMESSIVFALTSALFGEITLEHGVVQQNNFDDYPILRMHQTPRIDVVVVPSTEAPSGVGEPGVPPLAPALANALFAATGERLRSLPLRNLGFTIA